MTEQSKNCIIFDIESMIYQVCNKFESEDIRILDPYINEIESRIRNVLTTCNATYYIIFLDNNQPNFRHKIYPDYKSGRNSDKPRFYAEVKKHLKINWGGNIAPIGLEADDMCLIHLLAFKDNFNIIIATIDKDLRQHPGKYFNYKLNIFSMEEVNDQQAYRNLWYQVLVGDSTDNVKGLGGCGSVGANNILNSIHDVDLSYKVWCAYTENLGLIKGSKEMNLNLQLVGMVKYVEDALEYAPNFEIASVCELVESVQSNTNNF
jgi:5'-3' exonuclease